MIVAVDQPATLARRLRARIFWLHDDPLRVGATLGVRVGTAERRGSVTSIEEVIDPGNLAGEAPRELSRNTIGEVEIELGHRLAVDTHARNPRTGRVVLDLGGRIAGGGLVVSLGHSSEGAASKSVDRNALLAFAHRLNDSLGVLRAHERIAQFLRELRGKAVFTTSFGPEDQAILHMLSRDPTLQVEVVTLDTGRLFPETYALWAETERRYGRRIQAIYPQQAAAQSHVAKHGINGFYDTVEARLACCHVRKVEPLSRALAGAAGWLVGLRADQSGNRRDTELVSVDARGLLKFSPLFDWSLGSSRELHQG